MASRILYRVYDKDKNDDCIGSFTPDSANKLLGVSRDRVSMYAIKKSRYKGRYLFVAESRDPIRNVIDDALSLDWDFTVSALKAMAGGGKRGS